MRAMIFAALAGALLLAAPVGAFAQGAAMPSGVKVTGGMFVDAKGMTLYTTDNDKEAGKSACIGQCLTNWPVLSAAADAKAVGDWMPISRDDGSKQWAYKGKPLYTFARDAKPGDMTGDGRGPWHAAKP